MSTNKNYRCERIVGYVGKKNITTDVPGTYKQTSIMARLMVWSAYSNKFPVSIKDCVTFVDYASNVAENLGVVDTILPSRRNYEFNDFDLDITKDEVSATMFDSVEDKITTPDDNSENEILDDGRSASTVTAVGSLNNYGDQLSQSNESKVIPDKVKGSVLSELQSKIYSSESKDGEIDDVFNPDDFPITTSKRPIGYLQYATCDTGGRVVDVLGDGSCFYYAIMGALGVVDMELLESSSADLYNAQIAFRRDCYEYYLKHSNRYDPILKEELMNLNIPGGLHTAELISDMFRVIICTHVYKCDPRSSYDAYVIGNRYTRNIHLIRTGSLNAVGHYVYIDVRLRGSGWIHKGRFIKYRFDYSRIKDRNFKHFLDLEEEDTYSLLQEDINCIHSENNLSSLNLMENTKEFVSKCKSTIHRVSKLFDSKDDSMLETAILGDWCASIASSCAVVTESISGNSEIGTAQEAQSVITEDMSFKSENGMAQEPTSVTVS